RTARQGTSPTPRVTSAGDDAKRVVRDGYEAAAQSYLAHRPRDAGDVAALAQFTARVPVGGRVLDLGCGAGVPVTQHLHRVGYRVVGLDFSITQLRLARENVPVPLTQADMTALPFRAGWFDGVVAYYSIIHVPRGEHATIAGEVHRVLVPGGHGLLVLGTGACQPITTRTAGSAFRCTGATTTPRRTCGCCPRPASRSN